MPSSLEVKKQIGAITNTRKITKAMQLVATSRMKTLQKKAQTTRDFAGQLIDLWKSSLSGTEVNFWQETRPASGKNIFILYSSDKGLCGGMNQQLIKTLLNSQIWQQTPEDQRIVLVFGRKGADYLRFRKVPVAQAFVGLPDNLTPDLAYGYIDQILDYWKDPNVESIHMVAPHYKNSFTFYPLVKQFLPITPDSLSQHLGPNLPADDLSVIARSQTTKQSGPGNSLVYFEPSKPEIAQSVLENLASSLFLQAFYELKATEYSSRMLAMQNATNSAEKLIEEKTRLLNSIRQQRITQEIAEITGSATVIN